MRTKKYPVMLSESEQAELLSIINSGKHYATLIKRANILLQLDESAQKSKTQKEIAEVCHCCIYTVHRLSERYAHGALNAAMEQVKCTGAPRKITGDGAVEVRIIQLACSQPPPGYARWMFRLLEEKVMELEIVPAISNNTIGRLLKKRHLSLIQKSSRLVINHLFSYGIEVLIPRVFLGQQRRFGNRLAVQRVEVRFRRFFEVEHVRFGRPIKNIEKWLNSGVYGNMILQQVLCKRTLSKKHQNLLEFSTNPPKNILPFW